MGFLLLNCAVRGPRANCFHTGMAPRDLGALRCALVPLSEALAPLGWAVGHRGWSRPQIEKKKLR